EQIYDELADDDPGGMLGAATARAEAQVLRLSVAYALTDRSSTIEVAHLDAAHALWQYCRASAAYIFGDASGDPLVEKLVQIVHEGSTRRRGEEDNGDGVDRSELHSRLGGHTSRADLNRAIETATRAGHVHEGERRGTGGRSAHVLYPGPAPASEAKEAKQGDDRSYNSLRSQESQPPDDSAARAASSEPRPEEPPSHMRAIMRSAEEGKAHQHRPDDDPPAGPKSA